MQTARFRGAAAGAGVRGFFRGEACFATNWNDFQRLFRGKGHTMNELQVGRALRLASPCASHRRAPCALCHRRGASIEAGV